ncbi:uncharacterized protein LOC103714688 isoform X2 [Phoenix dactylifera]|uniref:Uncharacterized protein LOC103714688 isoform X2 n=1 Tax=Phoenix dactylifera TaxID=42345 RepID=A0A8B9AY26_PHODC|nr:uncharacterized protein LOC103714688 isoform X2 [Phoenix dactylifera]
MFEPLSTAPLYTEISRSILFPPPRPPTCFMEGRRTNRRNSRRLRSNCKGTEKDYSGSSRLEEDWMSSPSATPYQILGVDSTSCSPAQLKAAFRARVKEFHPDVCKDMKDADAIIRRVIQAYEILSVNQQVETTERVCMDPFEEPECVAYDLFVNEIRCVGKGCPYSCVKRAPHAFSFTGHGDDYLVESAVGQCPRRCIHYVTPSQRVILEDMLRSILSAPHDLAEADFLDSLIIKANFENNRYQQPKRNPKASSKYVDWS